MVEFVGALAVVASWDAFRRYLAARVVEVEHKRRLSALEAEVKTLSERVGGMKFAATLGRG
jgi:hypothetical protein